VRGRLAAVNPVFARVGENPAAAAWGAFGQNGTTTTAAFVSPIANFYMTDPITRCSETMAKCSALFVAASGKTGTHG
jgi:NADH-quinone oxidoreductase subunit G